MLLDDKGEPLDVENTDALSVMDTSAQIVPLRPIMDLPTAIQRLKEFRAFIKAVLVEGEDFGRIPGTSKDALFKAGADKLCEFYGLSDEYEEIRSVIDWQEGLFDYEFRCILKRGSRLQATGLGSCSSWESKYRYRDAARQCPACSKETIIKGKDDMGGGWVCWRKKGGCGKKFANEDPDILVQPIGRVPNADIVDLKNTVIKMAKKRAKIDATLAATRSSGIFTQDVDEDAAAEHERDEAPKKATAATAKPVAKADKADPTKSDDGYISESDRRGIFAILNRVGVSHEDFKRYLLENHEIDSTAKMTRAIADKAIAWLKMIEKDQHPENESHS